MDRGVTPPKRVTSPIWSTPPPCKQALRDTKGQVAQKSEKATKPRAVHQERHDTGPVTAAESSAVQTPGHVKET